MYYYKIYYIEHVLFNVDSENSYYGGNKCLLRPFLLKVIKTLLIGV